MPKERVTNVELDKRLALIEQRVTTNQQLLIKKFDAGWDLIVEKLKPLEEMKRKVDSHDKQISRWKGATQVLIFLVTAVFATLGIHIFHPSN